MLHFNTNRPSLGLGSATARFAAFALTALAIVAMSTAALADDGERGRRGKGEPPSLEKVRAKLDKMLARPLAAAQATPEQRTQVARILDAKAPAMLSLRQQGFEMRQAARAARDNGEERDGSVREQSRALKEQGRALADEAVTEIAALFAEPAKSSFLAAVEDGRQRKMDRKERRRAKRKERRRSEGSSGR